MCSLETIAGFDHLFPFDVNERTLYTEFARIQEAAHIHLPCRGDHVHMRFCHVYGFHDFRRAFGINNALALTLVPLQAMMRRQDFQTTQRYISFVLSTARQMEGVLDRLHTPFPSSHGGTGAARASQVVLVTPSNEIPIPTDAGRIGIGEF